MSNRDDGLIKISELAKLCDVPVPTIKHYMNKGLIDGPALRTSRNMAWYDPAMAPRIRAIRELQRTQFLPLDVIKDMLDGQGAATGEAAIVESVARAVRSRMDARRLSRAALIRTGAAAADLDWLVREGLATPTAADGEELWSGDDLALAETIVSARQSGLTEEMLPVSVLLEFQRVVQQLVQLEVQLFSRDIVPRAPQRLEELSDAAVDHSERLIRVLRRKHLVPALQAIAGSKE